MQTTNVRIDSESEKILREMVEREHLSRGKIIRKALIIYRQTCFLKSCAEAYANLKSDSKAWESEMDERENWDLAIGDGLEEER